MVKISEALASRLDFEQIISAAASRGSDYFPSRIGLRAVHEFPDCIKGLRRGWVAGRDPQLTEVLPIPKFGGGSRPAPDVDVPDRILFDALSQAVRGAIDPGIVNWTVDGEAREEIEVHLDGLATASILVTDVVSAYEYVNLDVLAEELLDICDDPEAAQAALDLTSSIVGRYGGLPQGLPSARNFADAYLSIVDRSLIRAGVDVYRWVDDYRIPCASSSAAARVRVALESELRAVGLVVNSSKTWLPDRETYAAWRKAHRDRQEDLSEIKNRITITIEEDYAEEEEAEPTEDQVTGVQPDPVLESRYAEESSKDPQSLPSHENYTSSKRLKTLLRELGRTGSDLPLADIEKLLARHGELTRDIAMYLRARIRAGHKDDTVERIVHLVEAEDLTPYVWQRGWLMHPLTAVRDVGDAALVLAERVLSDQAYPSFMRGRAAIVLANSERLPLGKDFNAVWQSVSASAQPDMIAAMARMPESGERKKLLDSFMRQPHLKAVVQLVTAESSING